MKTVCRMLKAGNPVAGTWLKPLWPVCTLVLLILPATPTPGAAQAGTIRTVPTPQAPDRQQEGPPLEQESPPLAARFGVSTSVDGSPPASQGDWYLLRGTDRIERVQPGAGTAEIWERDDRGDISLKRVFRPEARIIEYAPGDLRAMQLGASWEALGAAIDPRLLRKLERGAAVETPFGPATVFEGVLGGARTEVWWLEMQRLPARVVEERQDARFTIDLVTLHLQPPPGWPSAAPAADAVVETIDVSDLGDRHSDPLSRKVEIADAMLRRLAHRDR